MPVHDSCNFLTLKTLPLHDIAPVTSAVPINRWYGETINHLFDLMISNNIALPLSCLIIPNTKEDHFILCSGLLYGLSAPTIPVHRVVPVLEQIWAQLPPKPVLCCHSSADHRGGQSGTEESGQHAL